MKKYRMADKVNELLDRNYCESNTIALGTVKDTVSDVAKMTRGDALMDAVDLVKESYPHAAALLLNLAEREASEMRLKLHLLN